MKIKTLDMKKADGYVLTEFDLVRESLKEEGRYNPDLLYRGFNAKDIPILLETGQDNKKKNIFCASEKQITNQYSNGIANIFSYADFSNPAIAVFNPEFLEEQFTYAYRFKNPNKKLEALVGVYKLKY